MDDENTDVTVENGTENTDDYVEDTVSALSEPMDEEAHLEYSPHDVSVGRTTLSRNREARFKATPRLKNARSISSSGMYYRLSEVGSGAGAAAAEASRKEPAGTIPPDGSHLLQKAAAAAYNYRVVTKDVESEYLYAYYSEDDEKVYEDLCYVTFSNKTQEVCRFK